MALYTVGYQRLAIRELEEILAALRIDLLIDVRSRPFARRPEYRRSALERLLGDRYCWHGDSLGGRGAGPTTEGRARLKSLAKEKRILIMCMEEAPGECHRHQLALSIPGAQHIFREELVDAQELQRAIDDDDDYTCALWAEEKATA